MKPKFDIQRMCVAAVLCAIGILIPIISPVKIQLGPMSFTLASHVAVFIAMFISPYTALSVTLGTTVGFLLAGFTPIVVLRALSHLVFAMSGAYLLSKNSIKYTGNIFKITLFGLVLGIIHAACEVVVVTCFYFAGMAISGTFMYSVVFLVGGGTLIHSMMDFLLALIVWRAAVHVLKIPANYKPGKAK